jgi:hypothetical protein
MSIVNHSTGDHTIRRLSSIIATLETVAYSLDELENEKDLDFRWELLCLAEDLLDRAAYITIRSRDIAWLHTPLPDEEPSDSDFDSGF